MLGKYFQNTLLTKHGFSISNVETKQVKSFLGGYGINQIQPYLSLTFDF